MTPPTAPRTDDEIEQALRALAEALFLDLSVKPAVPIEQIAVGRYRGEWQVGVCELDPDTGELYGYDLVSGDGTVTAPELAAALGLSAPAAELARRIAALGIARGAPAPEPPELDEDEAAHLASARAELPRKLRTGTATLRELMDEIDGDLAAGPLLQLLLDEAHALEEEMQAWPALTAVDRIERAFERLRQQGIVGVLGAGDTLSHGWEVVTARADGAQPPPGGFWGATFCHAQDLEHALAGEPFCLAFGSLADGATDEEAVTVGRAVCAALAAEGIETAWSGSVKSRITVGPLPWQRRVPLLGSIHALELRAGTDLPPALLARLPQLRALSLSGARRDLLAVPVPALESLTIDYDTDRAARAAFPAWMDRAHAQFPQLKELRVRGRDYDETKRW